MNLSHFPIFKKNYPFYPFLIPKFILFSLLGHGFCLKFGQDLDFKKDRKRIKTSEWWEVIVGLVNPTYLTAGHETEHVLHWFLHSRNTGGNSVWQIKIAQKFGRLKTKKDRNEAKRCTKSICNYTPIDVDIEKYRKNYIEIKGRKAGLKTKKQYDGEGQSIRKNFPHIPQELL